ncbi:MAG: hypothetical protein HYY90_04010 [Candidatus Omnitrophica bacterium]|nr:hypothetical protein [Candidatus Omnitrophota bacterium]
MSLALLDGLSKGLRVFLLQLPQMLELPRAWTRTAISPILQPIPDVFPPVTDVFSVVMNVFRSIPAVLPTVTDVLETIPRAALVPDVPRVFASVPDILAPIADILSAIPHVFSPVPAILAAVADVFATVDARPNRLRTPLPLTAPLGRLGRCHRRDAQDAERHKSQQPSLHRDALLQ